MCPPHFLDQLHVDVQPPRRTESLGSQPLRDGLIRVSFRTQRQNTGDELRVVTAVRPTMERRLHRQPGDRPAHPYHLGLNRIWLWMCQDNPPDQTAQERFLVSERQAATVPEGRQCRS